MQKGQASDLTGDTSAACPICRRGEPLDIVAELARLRELGAAFMRDAQRVSRALATSTGATKLNYEIHGNTIPHLHMHFFPRYRDGDRTYAPGEFEMQRAAFTAALLEDR